MARFIRFPWATTGDRATVPFDTDPGGSVTYAQGFGPDYEIAPGDPGWKPVPRDETNGFYYDLTENIRQYQLNGAPDWHPAADNAGVAIAYPINATVRHNDLVYRSLTATNTAEPGTDPAKWVVVGIAGPATTAVAGLMRFATPAEAAARIVTDAAVTPAGLGALFNLLLNQPIFPEVALGGMFTVTSPAAGTVRVGAGTSWTHRGAFSYTSAQTDLATVANKTYHLRWDRVNGFALYDLAAGSYNPSAVPETDISFDTTYDSMLVARVVTSAANVSTITTLINRARLDATPLMIASDFTTPAGTGAYCRQTATYNWARTPLQKSFSRTFIGVNQDAAAGDRDELMFVVYPSQQIFEIPATRYASTFLYQVDGMDNIQGPARLTLSLGA
jgi:hypothetical protein